MTRRTLQPAGLFNSRPWGFSQIAITAPGYTVHVAGQVAWNAEGKCTETTLEGQFRQTLQQVLTALAEVNCNANDIDMLHIYVCNFKSGSDADILAKVLVEFFGTENPPPSSWIGVEALAQPEYLVEVEATATVSEDRLPK